MSAQFSLVSTCLKSYFAHCFSTSTLFLAHSCWFHCLVVWLKLLDLSRHSEAGAVLSGGLCHKMVALRNYHVYPEGSLDLKDNTCCGRDFSPLLDLIPPKTDPTISKGATEIKIPWVLKRLTCLPQGWLANYHMENGPTGGSRRCSEDSWRKDSFYKYDPYWL